MTRTFNIKGPCQPEFHYMVSPTKRLPNLLERINRHDYFILQAPEQSGKTTSMLAFAKEINQQGKYLAVVLPMIAGVPFPDDPAEAARHILIDWQKAIQAQLTEDMFPPPWSPNDSLESVLQAWAKKRNKTDRPLVVFLDDIDALYGKTLEVILRAIQSGYSHRNKSNYRWEESLHFPRSLVLTAVNRVHNFNINLYDDEPIAPKFFNICSRSFRLPNFSRDEVEELLMQHTHDTGQVFSEGVIDAVYKNTGGQPWLVNALMEHALQSPVTQKSPSFDLKSLDISLEVLGVCHYTNLKNSRERLLKIGGRIMTPMMYGSPLDKASLSDIEKLIDMGLCTITPLAEVRPANPIYNAAFRDFYM